MPQRLEKTALLPRAFAPVILPTIDPRSIAHILYDNNRLEYAETVSKGTVAHLNEFTEEEKIVIERFNDQFKQIIEFIRAECIRLQVSDYLTSVAPDESEETINLLDQLATFSERYSNRVYYSGEQASFYTQIKRSLEIIAYNLRENSALHNTDKKRLLEHLILEIRHCAGGVFQHIETAKIDLSSHETLDVWLAKFRLMLIQQYAGSNPHVEYIYLNYAINLGWNPYGFETQSAVHDSFSTTPLYNFQKKDKDRFKKYFLEKYTPTAIMETLATGLYRCITEKLKDNNPVIDFQTLGDFRDFFSGIPLITEDNINIHDIFSMDPPSADSPILFKFADQCFYQKPIPELMQSMTSIFADTGSGFFEIYRDPYYYTLVQFSPDLCHQHAEEETPPEATQNALNWLKTHETHLNDKLFSLFYDKEIRDFSRCTLDNLDLSKYTIEALNFKNAIFYNQKVTLNQFVCLFKSNIQLLMIAQHNINNLLFNEIDVVLRNFTPADKGILLFYALAYNQPELIVLLLQAGADASTKNHVHTAIEVAAVSKQWECVKAFAAHKTDEHDSFRYGLALGEAAKSNQLDVIKILITAGAPLNWCDPININKTALHFAAAHHDNTDMVQILLDAGADASIKNSQGHTAIALAAIHKKRECVKIFALAQSDETNTRDYGAALVLAALNNQWDVVRILIGAKTPVHRAIEGSNNQALHLAVLANNADMVSILAGAGNSNLKNSDGHAALDIALEKNYPECALALLVQSLNPNFGKLYRCIKNRKFSSDVNTHFLNFFHRTLEKDHGTHQDTKDIIINHFIDILEKNEQKDEERDEANNAILIKISNSRKTLEEKLNKAPPMSIGLQVAFDIFVAAIFCLPLVIAGCSAAAVVSIGVGAFIGFAPCRFFAARDAHRNYTQKKQQTQNLIDSVFSAVLIKQQKRFPLFTTPKYRYNN